MTRGQAIAEIQRGLGFRSDLKTQISFLMDEAQKLRESPAYTLPSYLKKEDQSIVLTPNVSQQPVEVAIPSDFISEVTTKEGNMRFRPNPQGRTFFLNKMDLQAAEIHYYGSWISDRDTDSVASTYVPGQPRAYVQRASTFRFYPAPDQSYTITWDYYAHDTLPSALADDNQSNKWLTRDPWVLVGMVGMRLAADMGNGDGLQVFTGILQNATSTLITAVAEREIRGRDLRMGRAL